MNRWNRHGDAILSAKIRLCKFLLVGLHTVIPWFFFSYFRHKYLVWPKKFEIPAMEVCILIYVLVVTALSGIAFMDAHTGRISNHDAMERVGSQNEYYRIFQHRERQYAGEERNWLCVLVLFSVWSVVQIWHVCTMWA